MMSFGKFALIACTTSAIGACSSSEQAAVNRIFSEDAGTAIDALTAGKTLKASGSQTSGLKINYKTGETAVEDSDFAIKKNDKGAVTILINGVEQVFASTDQIDDYDFMVDNDGKEVWLWSQGRSLDDQLDGDATYNAQVWGYYSDNTPDEITRRGFAVVGTETKAAALASMPAATYAGTARLDVVPASGFVNNSTSRTRVYGNVEMTADFGASTISGQISDIFVQPPTGTGGAVGGTVAMEQTAIKGNGFAGDLLADSELAANLALGSDSKGGYAGKFYGKKAEEAAGTLSLTGPISGRQQNAAGAFLTSKTD